MATLVALLRGINVGTAKRVRMEDLRSVVEGLGYSDVKTLLNSGNVVMTSPRAPAAHAGKRIEEALARKTGISSRVTVLSAKELAVAIDECPLVKIAKDPSRLGVAVPSSAAELGRLKPLTKQDWSPEALAVGSRVAYVWCPNGVIKSSLSKEIARSLRDDVTTRNWSTMTKLLALTKPR